jgi:FkbM family methyltransferase
MQARVKNFVVEYEQEEEFNDLKREIFGRGIYFFDTQESEPIIIDGGAHIGLATLYFKWLYPQGRVWAFEPNEKLARLWQQNMDNNAVTGVTLIRKALGKHESEGTAFYIDKTAWQWHSTGSFYLGAWSGEQKEQQEIKVAVTQLKRYVRDLPRVDLLKLDIEGAEMGVILSLRGEALDKVRAMIFEWHARGAGERRRELIQFLRKSGFTCAFKDRTGKYLTGYSQSKLVLVEARRER